MPHPQRAAYLEQAEDLKRTLALRATDLGAVGFLQESCQYEWPGHWKLYQMFQMVEKELGALQSILRVCLSAAEAASALEHPQARASMLETLNSPMKEVGFDAFLAEASAGSSDGDVRVSREELKAAAQEIRAKSEAVACAVMARRARGEEGKQMCCVITTLGATVTKTFYSNEAHFAAFSRGSSLGPQGKRPGSLPALAVIAAAKSLSRLHALGAGSTWVPSVAGRVASIMQLAAVVHRSDGMFIAPETVSTPHGSYENETTAERTVDPQLEREQLMGAYKCSKCGKVPANRKDHSVCGRCKKTYYCGVECQRAHWKTGHRETCQPSAGAAAKG